jgi:hypothetical protein
MAVPTAPIVAGSLVGGYWVARSTEIRALGGAVLSAGGAISAREWRRNAGPVGASVLSGIYYASFAISHPLAKKIGAWPAVLTAAGVSATAAWLISDRRR